MKTEDMASAFHSGESRRRVLLPNLKINFSSISHRLSAPTFLEQLRGTTRFETPDEVEYTFITISRLTLKGARPDRLIAVTAREERSGLDSRWGWSELDTEVPRPAPTKRPSGHASSGRPNRGEARARRTRPDVPAKELRPADRAVRKRSLAPEGPPEERSTGHIWRQIREAGRSKNGGKEGAASKVRDAHDPSWVDDTVSPRPPDVTSPAKVNTAINRRISRPIPAKDGSTAGPTSGHEHLAPKALADPRPRAGKSIVGGTSSAREPTHRGKSRRHPAPVASRSSHPYQTSTPAVPSQVEGCRHQGRRLDCRGAICSRAPSSSASTRPRIAPSPLPAPTDGDRAKLTAERNVASPAKGQRGRPSQARPGGATARGETHGRHSWSPPVEAALIADTPKGFRPANLECRLKGWPAPSTPPSWTHRAVAKLALISPPAHTRCHADLLSRAVQSLFQEGSNGWMNRCKRLYPLERASPGGQI
ncbi:hypothetical protein HPB47_021395 [Ixodes persulcatus]|uniref:Uncharacterized protein n=1 Tax=Ixodes persulcatus TaxID=34615 RepID=A0AC60QCP2_IXOPE|nr:hypothetical protein HPB47_021395 [Ixodes persulcatus]